MKKFKYFLYSALSFALLAGMVACESTDTPEPEPEPGPGDSTVVASGTTFLLSYEKGAKAELEFDKTADWQLANANAWLSVSPLSGVAGKTKVTATALEANEALAEKEGTLLGYSYEYTCCVQCISYSNRST